MRLTREVTQYMDTQPACYFEDWGREKLEAIYKIYLVGIVIVFT